MNLDLLPIGWVHLGASLLALAAGTLVLARPKGTPVHKRRGRIYALSLLVTNVTALGIYRRGIFFGSSLTYVGKASSSLPAIR